MRRRHHLATTLATAIILTVAGCSSGGTTSSTSTPTPSATPDATVPQALPYAGAPKVPTPFPESIFAGDPCADTLTAEQIDATLGAPVRSKRADDDTVGPGCDWANTSTGGHAIMRYATKLPGGLSAIYENVKPIAEVWKPIESLQGFPAIAYVSPSGGSPDRFCQMSIGATDSTTIEISAFLSTESIGEKDPCDAAKLVADSVMSRLRAKAGV